MEKMEKRGCGCGCKGPKAEIKKEDLKKAAKAAVKTVEGYTKADHDKKAKDLEVAFGDKPAVKTATKAAAKPAAKATAKVAAKPAVAKKPAVAARPAMRSAAKTASKPAAAKR